MDEDYLILSYDGPIATIVFNRGSVGNPIDLAMAGALHDAADRLHSDGSARVVLLRATGKLFSGGGDIHAFDAATQAGAAVAAAYMDDLVHAFHRALLRLLAYDAAIVAAVHGPAAGAGMSLVLAADFSYLAPQARLVPAYAGIGLSGDGGATWLLPRLCGMRKAAEILMLNKAVPPAEAVSLGLVTDALPESGEAFQAAVRERALQIAAGPRQAIGALRTLLRSSAHSSLDAQLELEAKAMIQLAGGPELPEGLRALREKRPPAFP